MIDALFQELLARANRDAPIQRSAATQIVQPMEQKPPTPMSPPHKQMDIPHSVFLSGALSDIATTHDFLTHPEYLLGEGNPFINRLPTRAMLPVGAAMEALTYLAGRKLLKDKHPKIFNGALIAAGLLHGGLATQSALSIDTRQRANEKLHPGRSYNPNTGDWHPANMAVKDQQ